MSCKRSGVSNASTESKTNCCLEQEASDEMLIPFFSQAQTWKTSMDTSAISMDVQERWICPQVLPLVSQGSEKGVEWRIYKGCCLITQSASTLWSKAASDRNRQCPELSHSLGTAGLTQHYGLSSDARHVCVYLCSSSRRHAVVCICSWVVLRGAEGA